MGILEEVSAKDVQRRGLVHKSGLYILRLDEVTARTSQSGNRYINLRFHPLAYAASRGEAFTQPDHAAPLFDVLVPVTQEGINRNAASRIVALIAALTGNEDVEAIKREFDADSVDELAKKIATLTTLKLQAWVSRREEVDARGNNVVRNRIANYEPVPEEIAAQDLDLEEDGIPF